MSNSIPTYELASLAAEPGCVPGLFFGHQAAQAPVRIDIPYRSGYYKVGICLRGHAQVKVNLEAFEVVPHSLVLTAPHTIKQWVNFSADYHAANVFFTRDFVATAAFDPDQLPCFAPGARPAVPLPADVAPALAAAIRALQARHNEPPAAYQAEILRLQLQVLLYELAAAYEASARPAAPVPARSSVLLARFKELLQRHYLTERSLDFYAGQLCITPKHLTETVKKLTGRTAGDWLAETIALEAKVLLHDPTRSIAQVADQLRFADQSAFGRFFRNCTGVSPSSYRSSL